MSKVCILIAMLTLLSACYSKTETIPNQCLRTTLFERCMAHAPRSYAQVDYEGWQKVVSECGSQSYNQSLRVRSTISTGCRPSW
jgi:hypothetical protein